MILIGIGEEGRISATVNALNGTTIDTMTPPGKIGNFAGEILKEITKVQ